MILLRIDVASKDNIFAAVLPEVDGGGRDCDDDPDLCAALDGLAVLVGGEDPARPHAVVLLANGAHLYS